MCQILTADAPDESETTAPLVSGSHLAFRLLSSQPKLWRETTRRFMPCTDDHGPSTEMYGYCLRIASGTCCWGLVHFSTNGGQKQKIAGT